MRLPPSLALRHSVTLSTRRESALRVFEAPLRCAAMIYDVNEPLFKTFLAWKKTSGNKVAGGGGKAPMTKAKGSDGKYQGEM